MKKNQNQEKPWSKVTPVDPYMKTRASEFLPKVKNLKNYFIDKLCTIVCKDSSLVFNNPEQYYKHFLGFVEEFDEEGVLVRSVDGESKQYYFKENILGIVEEKVKKADKKVVKDIKEKVCEMDADAESEDKPSSQPAQPEEPKPISLESLMEHNKMKEG